MYKFKPVICVDFDGVIHSYEKGWQGGELYGEVVPGFFEWYETVRNDFDVVVFSTRLPLQQEQVNQWITEKWDIWVKECGRNVEPLNLTFSAAKPMAHVYIDDRAIQFNGDWDSPDVSLEAIESFKPWTQRVYGNRIKRIDINEASRIIETREPRGLFYAKSLVYSIVNGTECKILGIDNTDGNAWTEEFKTMYECESWLLKREVETNEDC